MLMNVTVQVTITCEDEFSGCSHNVYMKAATGVFSPTGPILREMITALSYQSSLGRLIFEMHFTVTVIHFSAGYFSQR